MNAPEKNSIEGQAFGVDVGGSGIKGGLVDLRSGELVGDRLRIPTPATATPADIARVVAQIVESFDVDPYCVVGVTVPGVVRQGVMHTAANIDPSWVGVHVNDLFSKVCRREVIVFNDADAAGYAETIYGAAKGVEGVVLVTTLGTGIGSALICDGVPVPNTEFGHLQLDGYDAEFKAADSARERDDLTWEQWAQRLQRFFSHLEFIFSPDLFVVGGGVSKRHEKFLPLITVDAPIVPAQLRNAAGIVGAAALAQLTISREVLA